MAMAMTVNAEDRVEPATGIEDRKMMSVMLNPYFLVPQLIVLGFAPIILANLKMLVMKALMMNQMALSAAVFMTIKNMVFGPSTGPEVKYVNYGYKHTERHKRSTLNRPIDSPNNPS